MIINGQKVIGKQFAYDGCHKMYIIEDSEDLDNALNYNYDILPIEKLEQTYENSCELKFIHNWKLDKCYVAQFENAEFCEGVE